MNDQATWHKALVMVMRKLGIVEILVTDQDIEPLNSMKQEDMPSIIMEGQEDGLHIRLVKMVEAKAYADAVKAQQPSIIMPSTEIITEH